MGIIKPGRVCIVIKGADAGKEVVIKEVIDKNFVIIAGEKVKERRANIYHLELTSREAPVPKGKEIKKREKVVPEETKKPAARKAKKEEIIIAEETPVKEKKVEKRKDDIIITG